MKLNFWQWLGLIVLIVAVGGILYQKSQKAEPADAPRTSPPATTQPAAE